jgi:hypothetical protein
MEMQRGQNHVLFSRLRRDSIESSTFVRHANLRYVTIVQHESAQSRDSRRANLDNRRHRFT